MFRSLRHRNARLYFLGLVVSNVGTWLQATAMAWLVLRLSDSGTALGLVVAAQFVPMLLLGPVGGVLADRFDKRRLVFWTQALAAVQAVALGVADLTGVVTLPMVFALALVLGVINAIDNPSRRSFISELVEPSELANAMSLNTAVMTGSRIFGPALAGLLIAWVGTGWCFVANGVSFAAVLTALVVMDRSQIHSSARVARAGGQVREGLRYAWADPVLKVTLLTLLVVSTFAFNYQVVLPLLVEREYGGGSAQFGALLAASSVGSLLGSLLTARLPRATLRFMLLALAALAGFNLLLAVSPTLWMAFVVSIPMGAGGAAFIAASSGLLLQRTAPELRGRILALQATAFLGSTPIGSPIVGWVSETFGARAGIALGGIVAVGSLAAATVARRRLVRVGVPPPAPAPVRVVLEPSAPAAGA
jgi:MFS family permease